MITIPTFLKWAGGKRRILDKIAKHFPERFDTYYEPFLGGGSVFFYVKQVYNPKYCTISDINEDLINTYIAVRDQPFLLMRYLSELEKSHSKGFYYQIRKKFNSRNIRGVYRCAVFIYLNKTCFNGLYRVNAKGEFNVPWGNRNNPELFFKDTILMASRLLQGVNIICQPYEAILPKLRSGSFVYLDPCYDPLKKTSFANYTPQRFCVEDRIKLHSFIRSAQELRAHVVLSNNDVPEVRTLYAEDKIVEISAPRLINTKRIGHGNMVELLICIESC